MFWQFLRTFIITPMSPTNDNPGRPYKLNLNKLTGLITLGSLQSYPTYQISLAGVYDAFKDTLHGWDKDYESAQRVFG